MRRTAAIVLAALAPAFGQAGDAGVAARGASGGVAVPDASVLGQGDIAYSIGNWQEPELGTFRQHVNQTFGVGLAPNFELFGRYANYQNPSTTGLLNGPRDVSANFKWRLPQFWRHQPGLAVGATDFAGGAKNFGSIYGVASDRIGPLGWTLGYARGSTSAASGRKTFDGAFGGLQLHAGNTGLSALAEYDGQQKYAGVRYRSPSLHALSETYFVASVQRSFGAKDAAGRDADRTSATITAVVPLGEAAERPRTFQPSHTLASLDAVANRMPATAEDRLDSLRRALIAAGFERVRAGTLGADVIVEYENHVFGQTEADALGIVLGLATELAPAQTRRVRAIVLKATLPVYEVSIGVNEYRAFLRSGDAAYTSGNLAVDRAAGYQPQLVRWSEPAPGRRNWVHFQLEPDLVFNLGTEISAGEYSLAGNLKTFIPLWRGAEIYTNYVQHVSNSANYDENHVFAPFRQRNGLKAATLQQSIWAGPHILVTAGAGLFRYDSPGVQLESTIFVPGRDDVVRVKAAAYRALPGESRAQATPLSASYRWVPWSDTWVEAGVQQYTDGSHGPSIVLTRWFGEVGTNLFFRQGNNRRFAGLELTIPLTPRRGADAGPVTFNGAPAFTAGYRTRVVTRGGTNFVQPSAVRDFPLEYSAESRLLNGGRDTQRYFVSQLSRMREAFYVYARERLPE